MKWLPLVLLLAACTPAIDTSPRQTWCEHNSPREWSDATMEAMTPDERRKELVYQELGELRCGWDK